MKLRFLLIASLLLPGCSWLKSHPVEVKEMEMTAEEVALEAARELIKQEYGIILPPKAQPIAPAQ